MYPCVKCQFQSRHLSKLLLHYKFVHQFEQDFQFSCSVDGCGKTYTQTASYLKHVKRKHSRFYQSHFSKWRETTRGSEALDFVQHVSEGEDDGKADVSIDNVDTEIEGSEDNPYLCKRLSIFLLSLREESKLPSNVISKVVQELTGLIGLHHAEVSRHIQQYLAETASGECMHGIKNIFNNPTQVEEACHALDTEYKLNKYIKDHLGYVAPVEYCVEAPDLPLKHRKYQYVPVLETLKTLLQHDDVFAFVMEDHCSQDGELRDYCDGDFYKENALFGTESKALQIMLYFDEFTASNPIGHKVKNFKLGGFYMQLGNVPPKYRSQLYVIQLLILCMSSILKHSGFETVMEPLIHDLKILETEGITISKSDGDHVFLGTVSVVIADNLGAHTIGGFLESFNCLRNCRFCFVPRDNMHQLLDCRNLPLRSKEMHAIQLHNVQLDPTLSSVYGVKADSCLNKLNFYHIINGLPSDLAHDLFEGVVCDTLTNVIVRFVTEDIFSLQDLNNRISSFSFSDTDKSNRPTTLSSQLRNFKVKQTAAQMWCLTRFFPLIVGDLIPQHNPVWQTLLLLEDVLYYVCAPVIDRGHTIVMKDIIEDFHASFRGSFPGENIKPKMHFMLHYPEEMKKFGPLIHLQTMRFEGKHNYFKELVYRTKNKINICKSLVVRHQYYQCLFNTSNSFFSSGQFETTGDAMVPLCLLKEEYQQILSSHIGDDSVEIFTSTSVHVLGIRYHVGDCIVSNDQQDHFCSFSRIKHCLIIGGTPYLLCHKMITRDFERHFYAYMVDEDISQCELVKVADLKEPSTLGLYKHPVQQGQFIIVMKHMVYN